MKLRVSFKDLKSEIKDNFSLEVSQEFIDRFPRLAESDVLHIVDAKPFMSYLLIDPTDGVIKYAKRKQTKVVIQEIVKFMEKSWLKKKVSYTRSMQLMRVVSNLKETAIVKRLAFAIVWYWSYVAFFDYSDNKFDKFLKEN